MEPFAIVIGLVLLAGVGFYVSRPLVKTGRRTQSANADTLSLETQRESLYTQIKELDMDHATGKVNDEDYARLRAELVTQAAEVLKQIDGVTTASVPAAPSDDVEAMIAARRKTRSVAPATPVAATSATTSPQSAEADLEAAIAARRKTTAPAAKSLTCPTCGKPINADDAFCAKCGTALQPQAAR